MSKVSTQSNIRKSNIQWTAKKLKKEMENGNLNFDNAVQRNLVWDDSKKVAADSQHDLWVCDPWLLLHL